MNQKNFNKLRELAAKRVKISQGISKIEIRLKKIDEQMVALMRPFK